MSNWMYPPHMPDEPIQLLCFPFAGGGASAFRKWFNARPGMLGISAIQLPGRENRIVEPPRTHMRDIVPELTAEIAAHVHGPYAFFGHSLGARIAFEVIRALLAEGHPLPAHLFVSGSRPPEIAEPRPLHQLQDDAFVRELRRFGGTPKAILESEELMALFLPLLRADFAVDETHTHQEGEPLPVPITAFCGTDDHEASESEMRGWGRHSQFPLSLFSITGDHFFLHSASETLLRHVEETLAARHDPSDGSAACTPASAPTHQGHANGGLS